MTDPIPTGADLADPLTGGQQDPEARALWQLSCHWWTDKRIERACLDLQARLGLDVSVLVWTAWCGGHHGRCLSAVDIDAALSQIDPWRQDVIEPVRALRKQLRVNDPGLDRAYAREIYAKLREVELMSERREQSLLLDWMRRTDSDGARSQATEEAIIGNMTAYLSHLSPVLSDTDQAEIAHMAQAADRLIREGCVPRP